MFPTLTPSRCAAALAVVVGVQLLAPVASARPVCEQRSCASAVARPASYAGDTSYGDPYAEPLSALGGRTLAQVLSEHVDGALGPFVV
jgi:hypothetical protein